MSIRMRFLAAPAVLAAIALAGPVSGASAAVPTPAPATPPIATPTLVLPPAFQAGADAAAAGWQAGETAAVGGLEAGRAAILANVPHIDFGPFVTIL